MATITPDQPVRTDPVSPTEFAPGIRRVPVLFVNAYLVAAAEGRWVLVDTGLHGFASLVRERARARFNRTFKEEFFSVA